MLVGALLPVRVAGQVAMDLPPTSSSRSNPAPDEPVWKDVLHGSSPREILARVVEGDPLDLAGRCELRVRTQALLLDVRRLQLRSAAHVARHAPGYAGVPPIDVWLSERIRKATQELLQEQAELAADGALPAAPDDERLLLVAATLGIDPSLIGRGCVAFNRCTFESRATFVELVLEARDPEEWSRANSTTVERAMNSLRRALWALGVRDDVDLEDLIGGVDDDP